MSKSRYKVRYICAKPSNQHYSSLNTALPDVFAGRVIAGALICLWQISPKSPYLDSRTMVFDPSTGIRHIATYSDNSTLPSPISKFISTSTHVEIVNALLSEYE